MKYIILLAFLPLVSFGQIDSTDIFKEIDGLRGFLQIRAYWEKIHLEDQEYRGGKQSDYRDNINLLSATRMIEKHGYPLEDRFQEFKKTPFNVWRNNTNFSAKQQAFTIMNMALNEGEIRRDDFVTDLEDLFLLKYGRQMIDAVNSDPDYMRNLMKDLKVNVKRAFDYKSMVESFNDQNLVKRTMKSKLIGKWNDENEPYQIFQRQNGKFYFDKDISSGSYPIYELSLINKNDETRFEHLPSRDIFEVDDNGHLTRYSFYGREIFYYEKL